MDERKTALRLYEIYARAEVETTHIDLVKEMRAKRIGLGTVYDVRQRIAKAVSNGRELSTYSVY